MNSIRKRSNKNDEEDEDDLKTNQQQQLLIPITRKTSPIPIEDPNVRRNNNISFKNSPVLYNSSELLVPISAAKSNLSDVYNNNSSNNNINKNKANNPFYDNSKNDKYDLLFDNSTLDPFHDMELNAINDKEELKNILEQSSLSSNNKFNLQQSKDNNFGLPNINFNNNNLNV